MQIYDSRFMIILGGGGRPYLFLFNIALVTLYIGTAR